MEDVMERNLRIVGTGKIPRYSNTYAGIIPVKTVSLN